ncbi:MULTISPECIES: hypothetical protein [Providencia]|uniref:hypothetical protein n=1 Tax=Providencia TaxID=586 RepID=UPI00197FEB05|nr:MULTISPECIES: hypothetical protein [Providencia]MBN4866579.1 hypothetical protein [Providencia stuartii]MBN4875901.1 hypothetical protein [Providencia stuartii]MBN4880593.1 hypothetical protein [Providencia stuartii]MBN4885101.1 hypothetical protein [Providencia stuartii]
MNKYNLALIGLLSGMLLVTAGCGNRPYAEFQDNKDVAASQSSAKKLGTKWGEDVNSAVTTVNATRLTNTPFDTAAIYYRGERVPNHLQTMSYIALSPVEIQVTDERGRKMPMYRNNQGQYILPAQEGQRYQLTIKNTDRNRIYEVVTSVDGIDVLNGRTGSYQNSGYLIRPRSEVTIEGFRKSQDQVAAFRFAAPQESYVNQNAQGDERNIGVIGFALFEVREELPDCEANPFPADTQYAPAPCRKR